MVWSVGVKPKVTGLIPSQGTCLGCQPGPWWEAHKRQPHIDVSLPLFLPPFPSLKINKVFLKITPSVLEFSPLTLVRAVYDVSRNECTCPLPHAMM